MSGSHYSLGYLHTRARRAFCIGIFASAVSASAFASEVWVVTDRSHPVTAGPATRVTELDAPARIEAALAQKLPTDPTRAAAIARERLSAGGAELQRQLAAAYQGVVDAWSAGITKIPAVVVDTRFIIYGESDVQRAVEQIERYRSARHE